MSAPVLQVTGLVKNFGGVAATADVNLAVREGEIHAIIGPNGAGKTTLISQICGTLKPDAGAIVLRGHTITTMPAHRRAGLGMGRSFQITSLILDMSVADNAALAAQAHEGHSFRFWAPARASQTLRAKAMAALERVGLGERADTPAGELSHGERRQLEIAVALASEADFLVLDEPMAGMGVEESQAMIATLKALKGEKTMLLVEHDMDAVFALADRISVLVYGRIIATGSPADIRGNEDVRRAYLGED